MEIFEAIKERGGATLAELDSDVDRSKGTIHTYLTTFDRQGLVTREGDTYRLGYRFVTLGEHVRNHTPLYWAGWEAADSLAEETGEYVHLVVESNGGEVAIYEAIGKDAVAKEYHLRMRETPQELYDSAAGKALLAHLPAERIDDIVGDGELEPQTENTITDPEELRAELQTVRERGYAINDEEKIRGTRAVGAPILFQDGRLAGAVSVTAPASRLRGDRFTEDLPDKVMETANLIEVNLETESYDEGE